MQRNTPPDERIPLMPWPFLYRRSFDFYLCLGVLVQFLTLIITCISLALWQDGLQGIYKPDRFNPYEAASGWLGISFYLWIDNHYHESPQLYFWYLFHLPRIIFMIFLVIYLWKNRSLRPIILIILAIVILALQPVLDYVVFPRINKYIILGFISSPVFFFIQTILFAILSAWIMRKKPLRRKLFIFILILFALVNYLAGYFGPYEEYYNTVHPRYII